MVVGTGLEWINGLSWVMERTDLGMKTMDLTVWSFFEVVPNLVFLAVFYIYMFDITEYYKTDPNLGEGVFTTVIFTYYTNVASTWLTL
jgi:hypothetical protein